MCVIWDMVSKQNNEPLWNVTVHVSNLIHAINSIMVVYLNAGYNTIILVIMFCFVFRFVLHGMY